MRKQFSWLLALVTLLASITASAKGEDDQAASITTAAARVKHIFIIVLENKTFSDTFETSAQDPYLQKTLVSRGVLLKQYYGTGHVSLDNYISLISGQAPTRDTANDCLPGSTAGIGNFTDMEQVSIAPNGQVVTSGGCIYPASVKTLADQMTSAGLTWKAYMEDMGNDPARESATCGHPAIGIGTDNTNGAEPPSAAVPKGDAYAARHNPFVYFHSIIDSPDCQKRVVNLRKLQTDLARASTTPNLVFITPNVCHDGHDGAGTGAPGTTCANHEPGGLTSADAFLKDWVPRILRSPAYKKEGLLIITFDESDVLLREHKDPNTGRITRDSIFPGLTCCDEQLGPNLKGVRPGLLNLVNSSTLNWNVVMQGYGGDRIGALLLSPFVKPGSSSQVPYNHYSLLRSLEDIFDLHEHLGYAGDDPSIGYHLDTIGNDRSIFENNSSH
jgi:hypothetical protein